MRQDSVKEVAFIAYGRIFDRRLARIGRGMRGSGKKVQASTNATGFQFRDTAAFTGKAVHKSIALSALCPSFDATYYIIPASIARFGSGVRIVAQPGSASSRHEPAFQAPC